MTPKFKDYPTIEPLREYVLVNHGPNSLLIEQTTLESIDGADVLELDAADLLAARWACEHDNRGASLGAIRDTSTLAEARPGHTSGVAYTQLKARISVFAGTGWGTGRGIPERMTGTPLEAPYVHLRRADGTTIALNEGQVKALISAGQTRKLHNGSTDRLTPVSGDCVLAATARRMAQYRSIVEGLPSFYRALAEAQDRKVEAAEAKLKRLQGDIAERNRQRAEQEHQRAAEAKRRAEEERARRDEAARQAEEERQALEAATPDYATFDAEFAEKRDELTDLLEAIREAEEELADN